jgi:exodeoxyribonuclease V gamma subunit
VRIDSSTGPLEDAEPFSLTELAGWEADQRAFFLRRSGHSADEVRSVLRAAGTLPDGAAGDAALAERLADIDPIVAALDRATFVAPIETVIELPGTTPPVRLAIVLDSLTAEGGIVWRVGRLRAVDRLRAWLAHLALAALAPADVPPRTRLLSRTQNVLFGPAASPLAQLATLAGFYSGGSRELLPFFPETALAFARALAKGEEAAWGAAAKVWTDVRARDAYFSLAFRDVNPLDAKFAAHARSVCGPMLAAEIDDA